MPSTTSKSQKGPRILFITPEISHVSKKLPKDAERLRAKARGLAEDCKFYRRGGV